MKIENMQRSVVMLGPDVYIGVLMKLIHLIVTNFR